MHLNSLLAAVGFETALVSTYRFASFIRIYLRPARRCLRPGLAQNRMGEKPRILQGTSGLVVADGRLCNSVRAVP